MVISNYLLDNYLRPVSREALKNDQTELVIQVYLLLHSPSLDLLCNDQMNRKICFLDCFMILKVHLLRAQLLTLIDFRGCLSRSLAFSNKLFKAEFHHELLIFSSSLPNKGYLDAR